MDVRHVLTGHRPHTSFTLLPLPPAADRPVAARTRELARRAAAGEVDLEPFAVGVALSLTSARAGPASLNLLARTLGAEPALVLRALDQLTARGLAAGPPYQPRPELDLGARHDPGVRYISTAVQTLLATASVNQWNDLPLVAVGSAVVVLSAPTVTSPRRPVPTWRVADACQLDHDTAAERLLVLLERGATAGIDRHLPIVADWLHTRR